MIVETVLNDRADTVGSHHQAGGRDVHQAQQTIYQFLLEVVRNCEPEDALEEFKRLFIDHVETVSSTTVSAVYELLFVNNQAEFLNTLKRSCYILINNWETNRQYQAIQQLVGLFQDPIIQRRTVSPTLRRLRSWLTTFVDSKDYEELRLFASRYDTTETKHWSDRYTSYLLISQVVDPNNSAEQREAARVMAQRLKEKFKFDLAMYTAKSQSSVIHTRDVPENPTGLGEEALRLIKMIVMRRGTFSYANLANIFQRQTVGLRYEAFKHSLLKYIVFALPQEDLVQQIIKTLTMRLGQLYLSHHDDIVNDALLLRTCNRVIEYLTTEDRSAPSPLFCILLARNNPLPLVSILLKLILICPNSRTHLEARIADLVRYYQNSPEDECQWVVNFFEVFNITFTIYTENVEYSIVSTDKVNPHSPFAAEDSSSSTAAAPQFVSVERVEEATQSVANRWEQYRIFSQMRSHSDGSSSFSDAYSSPSNDVQNQPPSR